MNTNTYKEYNLEGLKLIGRGGTGECYQIDDDKVLKLYYEDFQEEWILREKMCAKQALISNIPTAISYELASVGNRKGVVYELVNAKTLAQSICDEPDRLEELATQYADLAKGMHSTTGNTDMFDKGSASLRDALKQVDYLSEAGLKNVKNMLDYLDQADTYIHGDFNPTNIFVKDGELLLIDMGEFAIGSPLIDLATLYFCLFCSPEAKHDGISEYTGMTHEQHERLWHCFIKEYYGVESYDVARAEIKEASLIEDVALLKEMRFAQLFGKYCDKEYSENIITKAIKRWEMCP